MKYLIAIILSSLALSILLFIIHPDLRNAVVYEIKFQTVYSDYTKWKKYGGPLNPDYYDAIMQDTKRDSLANGITESDLIRKFPFLVSGSKFGPLTYKGDYQKGIGNASISLLWFRDDDGFDWVIKLKDGIGISVDLIKG